MAVSKEEFKKMTEKQSPNSPILKNCIMAFLFGGFICTIGQLLLNFYKSLGLEKELASSDVSITLIFAAALLTGLKIYDNIAKVAGAGTLVPITGFANSIVSPAMEFKTEGYVMGLSAKMFIIAGPVLVYGITASVLYGIVLWLIRFF